MIQLQLLHWPLYSRPIDWICQEYNDREACTIKVVQELQSLSFRTQEDDTTTTSMMASQGDDESDDAVAVQAMELNEEKEDWFSQLSGGQKSKVELVRTVFLRKECPSVLLGKWEEPTNLELLFFENHVLHVLEIVSLSFSHSLPLLSYIFYIHSSIHPFVFAVDETMAPLDPHSKSQVMSKLKAFCKDSIVMVIYHTDVSSLSSSDGGNATNDDTTCIPSNSFFDSNLHVVDKQLVTRPVC